LRLVGVPETGGSPLLTELYKASRMPFFNSRRMLCACDWKGVRWIGCSCRAASRVQGKSLWFVEYSTRLGGYSAVRKRFVCHVTPAGRGLWRGSYV